MRAVGHSASLITAVAFSGSGGMPMGGCVGPSNPVEPRLIAAISLAQCAAAVLLPCCCRGGQRVSRANSGCRLPLPFESFACEACRFVNHKPPQAVPCCRTRLTRHKLTSLGWFAGQRMATLGFQNGGVLMYARVGAWDAWESDFHMRKTNDSGLFLRIPATLLWHLCRASSLAAGHKDGVRRTENGVREEMLSALNIFQVQAGCMSIHVC